MWGIRVARPDTPSRTRFIRRGSSPRAWGIPFMLCFRFYPFTVHPHARGAYASYSFPSHQCTAVHPHVRGAYGTLGYSAEDVGRFIPTCVGHTVRRVIHEFTKFGSSPRAWGIRISFPDAFGNRLGSSPRAWGIPKDDMIEELRERFIPTCVGHTLAFHVSHFQSPVHPHVRGAYTISRHARRFICLRFIPTCVGHTNNAQTALFQQGRFIPTCVGHTLQKSADLRGFNHLQTIEVYHPSSRIAKHFHAKALLILRGVKQYRSTCFTAFSNGIPQNISDCRADSADKNACFDFQHISCTFSTQPFRGILHRNHYYVNHLRRNSFRLLWCRRPCPTNHLPLPQTFLPCHRIYQISTQYLPECV